MGHIELAAPVTHIWYFKGVPSRLGYLLDLAPKDLEKIIYFASYVITSVNTETRHRDMSTVESEIGAEKRHAENARDAEIEKRAAKLEQDLAELEAEGAKADVRRKVKESGEEELREIIRSGKGQRKIRALKRLKVVAAFLNTNNSPLGMVLDCVPVIPPDLRPMVQLDGGRFATSDLNDLYRRVINRNNRLKRL